MASLLKHSGSVNPSASIALAAALAAAAIACSGPEAGGAPPRNASPSVRYVGRDACASCHVDIAASFARTGMGRSFYPLERATAVEDFTRDNRLDLPADGLRYEMTERAEGYAMRQSVLDAGGRTLVSVERPMRFVVGSGRHSRSYLTGSNGAWFEMPVCWYPERPGWDLCPGFELSNKFFTRRVDDACLFCHNARMETARGDESRYAEPPPHGIDCERCHGPGELHVARWKGGGPSTGSADDTIVNPARLPRQTRMQVCLQCHLGDSDGSVRMVRRGRDQRDFRPGHHLGEFFEVLALSPPVENRFGLSAQGDRLMLSRCFRESGGGLDCLTCHDPHVPIAAAKSRTPDLFRRACLGCHRPGDCALEESERRVRAGSDDCAQCHMRRSQPSDQRHTVFTDHWIRRRIDPPSLPASRDGEATLVALNPIPGESQERSEEALSSGMAYLHKRLEITGRPWIAPGVPESHLREAIALDPSLADGWFYLGRSALSEGRISEAIGDYREALDLEPEHGPAMRGLASALLVQERAEEALGYLTRLLSDAPEDLFLLSETGRALVMTGREEEARSLFERALALGPDHPIVLANAGLLEARQGRHEEAVRLLRASCANDPSQAEAWGALAASLRALGRAAEAGSADQWAVKLRPGLGTRTPSPPAPPPPDLPSAGVTLPR